MTHIFNVIQNGECLSEQDRRICLGREGRFNYLGTAAIDEIEMWPKSSSMVCSMVEVWYGRNPEHVERSESKR